MKKFPLIILAVLSSVILLSSCISNTNTTPPQSGAFLLAQTSPDAPKLEVFINNSGFDTLRFGNYTPYIGGVNAGTYEFIVDSFGTTTPSKLKSTVGIEANKFYSYFIIDSFAKVKAAWINDVFKAPSSDSVYVRFFNFSPNDSALSLVANGSIWSGNRTFNDQSNPQFVAFFEEPAGTYTLQLKTPAGNVLKAQNVVLTGGYVYTLFAKGTIGNSDTTRALSIGQLQNYPPHQ